MHDLEDNSATGSQPAGCTDTRTSQITPIVDSMKLTCAKTSACLFIIAGITGTAIASTAETGQEMARQCAVCHGSNGIANDPLSPNLAGQSAAYLEKSMKDFRAGTRQDPRMSFVAKELGDDDIKALAAWYSSFVIEVTVPE